MTLILYVVIVLSAVVFIYMDATNVRDEHDVWKGPRGITPLRWAVLVNLLWIVVLPIYYFKRKEAIEGKGPTGTSATRRLIIAALILIGIVIYVAVLSTMNP